MLYLHYSIKKKNVHNITRVEYNNVTRVDIHFFVVCQKFVLQNFPITINKRFRMSRIMYIKKLN